jgi:internalin A
MRNLFVIFSVFTAVACAAQSSLPANPWESVAPAGSQVFTVIRDAAKNASAAYRMEIIGPEQFREKKIDQKIAMLRSLMALRIADNQLTTFPTSFLQLHALVYFSSKGNAFATLPDSLGMLSNLRFIELHQTAFDTLPEGLYGLPRLQSLAINQNSDTLVFTNSIRYFSKSLIELRLYNTLIDSLPAEFGQMNALTKLVMYKCQLKVIPPAVFNLTGLSELWLDSNAVTVVPTDIARMQGLTYLSLRGNRITKVTSSICFLKNLVVLDLRGNPLEPYDISVIQALLPDTRILF